MDPHPDSNCNCKDCRPMVELDCRKYDGIEVTLYYCRPLDIVCIDLITPVKATTFEVPKDKALDAFNHPFCYIS